MGSKRTLEDQLHHLGAVRRLSLRAAEGLYDGDLKDLFLEQAAKVDAEIELLCPPKPKKVVKKQKVTKKAK